MNITDDIMAAAHEAWEVETQRWTVERSSIGATVHRNWMGEGPLTGAPMESETALLRFETIEQAKTFKRDKIIRAILAVLP